LLVGKDVGVDGYIMVGNLGGNSSGASGSSSDCKDCTDDETIREPLDIAEQPGNLVPAVMYDYPLLQWQSVEGPLLRLTKRSYLKKPQFVKRYYQGFQLDLFEGYVEYLTRFDDFAILGNVNFSLYPVEVIDIVRKNAFETVDVIAAQLVKRTIEKKSSIWSNNFHPISHPITAIVIFLDHKEILLREHKKEKKGNFFISAFDHAFDFHIIY